MTTLFGSTRTVVKERYALLTPDSFVPSALPAWSNAVCVVNISPAMRARFSQTLVTMSEESIGRGNTGTAELFVYVIEGQCTARMGLKTASLTAGGFFYLPPQKDFHLGDAPAGPRLLIFERRYSAIEGITPPAVLVGQASEVEAKPFLGNDEARLQVLLPDHPGFDMAVNIFTYQPGATLPFVESHIMEHGMLFLAGQGIYRIDADWHPVQTGDAIWMAPYCPQWFVAMGKTPASYIYYKDVNRAP